MEKILYSVKDTIATIILNRVEKLNALDAEMIVRLAELWKLIAEDEAVRVVILKSSPGKAFCTGADLKTLAPILTGARTPSNTWEEQVAKEPALLNRALLKTSKFVKPIISAIDGLAYGGGMELVLATDLRVATTRSEFALPEVRRGLIPAGGGLARLAKDIPTAIASRIVLVGEPIDAATAAACGLLSYVVSPIELDSFVTELAGKVASNGPLAVREAKRVLLTTRGVPLSTALHFESEAGRVVISSGDAREGALAFVERRIPQFTGH